MRVGTVTIAYNEERFIGPHLDHIPLKDKLVLLSAKPWNGSNDPPDGTEQQIKDRGVTYIKNDWLNEQDQRNAGQEFYADYDWVVVLDPDEFLLQDEWDLLLRLLETADDYDIYRCGFQHTYWKKGYKIDPPEQYKQFIAARPSVRFADRRDPTPETEWGTLPIELHHFSWARTDDECWSKIKHYGHAVDFNTSAWYNLVWNPWHQGMRDLHPTWPVAYTQAVPAILPPELEGLWP